MPGPRHELHALIQVAPASAKKKIVAALKSSGMHKGEAARLLGCSHGTLLRWIDALALGDEVERLVDKARDEGWYHGENRKSPGRPKGSKDSYQRTRRKRDDVNPG